MRILLTTPPRFAVYALAAGVVLGALAYSLLFRAPSAFPAGALIDIPAGSSVQAAGSLLEEHGFINSALLFRAFVAFSGGRIQAGGYVFTQRMGVAAIALRVARGEYGLSATRVTIPEGSSNREIAEILLERFPSFDAALFRELARSEEGYLFPDTYFFLQSVTPEEVITAMRQNFDVRITEADEAIAASGHSRQDIIIMASLLEKEARLTETRRTIAGILWRRIRIGMPLQVDAVFGYIFGRDTFHPSGEEILEIDSPYNTYENRGLPPGPIGNPGLDAVIAAATPIDTGALYYLTDAEGVMHYAKTFEEHKMNKERYLR